MKIGSEYLQQQAICNKGNHERNGFRFSDKMKEAQKTQSANMQSANRTVRDSYSHDTSIHNAGVYSRNDIAQQLELPIETDRYVIRDASEMEGVTAYFIGDRQTGKSVYIREDQLAIQRDSRTGFKFVINMEQPFCENVRVTDELNSILHDIAEKRNFSLEEVPMQGGLVVNQDPKTGLKYLSISGNEAKGVSVIITSEEDQKIIEKLADEFQKYPCASQRSTALLDALLEISGNLRRGREGFTYLTPIGIGYVPYVGKGTGKAWLIQMPNSQYAAARQHLAMDGYENGDSNKWLQLIKNGHIIYEDVGGLESYRTEGLRFGYMYN